MLINCRDQLDIQFHTDSQFTEHDSNYVKSYFPNFKIRFSDFNKSREKTLDNLQGKPNCQKFRANSIWGIEFFDPLFLSPNEPISFYIDADILFLRPFSGLFDPNNTEGGAVFLKDTQWDAYCFRPWQLVSLKKRPEIVKGITTGLVFWDKLAIDWDYLEWFLGSCPLHHISEWILPTAQAGLANRCEAKTVCPTQITNLYPNAKITGNVFGVHMLGSYRKKWAKKLGRISGSNRGNDKPILTRFQACKTQDFIGYSLRQLRRWKNTRLDIW